MERGNGAALGNGHIAGGRRAGQETLGDVRAEEAWLLVLAVRRLVDEGELVPGAATNLDLAFVGGACVRERSDLADVVIDPRRAEIVRSRRPIGADAREIQELHLAHALRPRAEGYVLALLGQSLDGFIATRCGHSRYINGEGSLTYLHRLRALSDAVIIGASTAVADRPRLTTRHVVGPHPVRVVIDPRGRLPPDSNLLHDGAAPTLVLRGTDGEPFERSLSSQVTALHLPTADGCIAPSRILAALAARGLTRLLIEGGGVTVGRFLEAGLLERLQLAVSPVIIGAGRPALPVTPVERLDQALRPSCRPYLMGEDVLFDLCLRPCRAGDRAPGVKLPGPTC
jgi:diaminohydroxyphosphoribosylaminopyrimidine deaminase / 5-amino-6-(5-phosphoribosylamino)uracil reductase